MLIDDVDDTVVLLRTLAHFWLLQNFTAWIVNN